MIRMYAMSIQEDIDKIEHKSTDDVYVCYPLALSQVPDMWAPGMEPLASILKPVEI